MVLLCCNPRKKLNNFKRGKKKLSKVRLCWFPSAFILINSLNFRISEHSGLVDIVNSPFLRLLNLSGILRIKICVPQIFFSKPKVYPWQFQQPLNIFVLDVKWALLHWLPDQDAHKNYQLVYSKAGIYRCINKPIGLIIHQLLNQLNQSSISSQA